MFHVSENNLHIPQISRFLSACWLMCRSLRRRLLKRADSPESEKALTHERGSQRLANFAQLRRHDRDLSPGHHRSYWRVWQLTLDGSHCEFFIPELTTRHGAPWRSCILGSLTLARGLALLGFSNCVSNRALHPDFEVTSSGDNVGSEVTDDFRTEPTSRAARFSVSRTSIGFARIPCPRTADSLCLHSVPLWKPGWQ